MIIEIWPRWMLVFHSYLTPAPGRQSPFLSSSNHRLPRRRIPRWHNCTHRGQLVSMAIHRKTRTQEITVFNALLPEHHLPKYFYKHIL